MDPFKHWLVWEKYLNARTIRGGLTTRRYGREMLCLYGDALGFFPSLGQGRTTKSKLFFLYKLTLLPSRSLQDVDGLYLYQQTHRLLSWATLLVEYPYLFFGRRWDWFVPSFSRALAPLSAHPILGPVFTFYATYYSALGSLALETCASFRALLSPF